MQLPYSDELNIGYLNRLFDDTTNCYKFFWFQAILRKVDKNHRQFSFSELINEMIIDAWYMVTEYHLRLGPLNITDNLEEVVKYIHKQYGFLPSEKTSTLREFLQNTDDKNIKKYKADLTQQVPYRLQVPFFDEISITKRLWDGSKKILSETINCQRRLMYYFLFSAGLGTMIEIDEDWAEYFTKHTEILKSWTQLKLIRYLQKRNPSVPGIADKLEAPTARDIDRVRHYWKLIIKIDPSLHDIYGDIDLSDKRISIDHFVPWQYVAHDELWNLHPTTKEINSSKSNSLPMWEPYFKELAKLEYRAYEMRTFYEVVNDEFQKIAPYHLNNPEIRNQLYADGIGEDDFRDRLRNVIEPVYESAKNQGFKEWKYDESNNIQ